MIENLKLLRLKGQEITSFLPDVAKLRIHIFKEYPYLYDGDLNYEYDYLKIYTTCAESVMVIVLDQNQVVGATSAIPLAFETSEIQQPFLDNGINVAEIFYFGESILLAQYRGRNLYRRFFAEREAAAKKYGCKIAAFAAVARTVDDPRKPSGYMPLDQVWQHFGYEKHPELCAYFKWKEIGESSQTPKPLIFWLKKL